MAPVSKATKKIAELIVGRTKKVAELTLEESLSRQNLMDAVETLTRADIGTLTGSADTPRPSETLIGNIVKDVHGIVAQHDKRRSHFGHYKGLQWKGSPESEDENHHQPHQDVQRAAGSDAHARTAGQCSGARSADVSGAPLLPPTGEVWGCSACTLINQPSARRCVVCNTRKPPTSIGEPSGVNVAAGDAAEVMGMDGTSKVSAGDIGGEGSSDECESPEVLWARKTRARFLGKDGDGAAAVTFPGSRDTPTTASISQPVGPDGSNMQRVDSSAMSHEGGMTLNHDADDAHSLSAEGVLSKPALGGSKAAVASAGMVTPMDGSPHSTNAGQNSDSEMHDEDYINHAPVGPQGGQGSSTSQVDSPEMRAGGRNEKMLNDVPASGRDMQERHEQKKSLEATPQSPSAGQLGQNEGADGGDDGESDSQQEAMLVRESERRVKGMGERGSRVGPDREVSVSAAGPMPVDSQDGDDRQDDTARSQPQHMNEDEGAGNEAGGQSIVGTDNESGELTLSMQLEALHGMDDLSQGVCQMYLRLLEARAENLLLRAARCERKAKRAVRRVVEDLEGSMEQLAALEEKELVMLVLKETLRDEETVRAECKKVVDEIVATCEATAMPAGIPVRSNVFDEIPLDGRGEHRCGLGRNILAAGTSNVPGTGAGAGVFGVATKRPPLRLLNGTAPHGEMKKTARESVSSVIGKSDSTMENGHPFPMRPVSTQMCQGKETGRDNAKM